MPIWFYFPFHFLLSFNVNRSSGPLKAKRYLIIILSLKIQRPNQGGSQEKYSHFRNNSSLRNVLCGIFQSRQALGCCLCPRGLHGESMLTGDELTSSPNGFKSEFLRLHVGFFSFL